MVMSGQASEPSRYIAAVLRRRWWVIVLWVVSVATAGVVYLCNFHIDNSVAVWFLEEDPELEIYREYNAEFGEREWTYLWLRGDAVFSPEFLRDLRSLRDQIEALPEVERVVSLADAGGIVRGEGGGPRYEKFYRAPVGELPDEEQIAALRDAVHGNPLFEGRLLVADEEHFTVVAVQNANKIDTIEPYRIKLMDEIVAAVAAYPSFLDSGIVGTTVINAELNRAARRDMIVYYLLIGGFVFVGGRLVLGSSRDLVALAAVVLGTVLPVMGAIAALGMAFNLITVMLPTLLVTVSVSYLIHFVSEFHVERRAGADPERAIAATFRRLLRPGLWTSATTAVGFASLAASPVAPIRHLGLFAALGIGLAWLNTVTVAPALLSLLWPASRPERVGGTRGDARLGPRLLFGLTRPRPLIAGLLLAAILGGALGVFRLQADTNYVEFFRRGSDVRQDYAQLGKIGLPQSNLIVTVRLPDGDRFADITRHRAMRRFEEALLRRPEVIDVIGLDGLIERYAADLGGDGGEGSKVGVLLVMAESGMMAETTEFLASGGQRIQLRVMTAAMSTRDIERFREGLDALAVGLPEEWEVGLTGTNVLWANMDAQVVRTQLLSLAITGTLLILLLPLALRSLLLGVVGFAVSFVPVLCTLGLMAWWGLPVNIATCLLGGVVLGLSVDDTIYFLSRVREGLGRGVPVGAATRRAVWTTGRAMIKTSLVLMGGFLTMAASDFLPSVYFGVFFAFSILVALLADLIVLPVLLRVCRVRVDR